MQYRKLTPIIRNWYSVAFENFDAVLESYAGISFITIKVLERSKSKSKMKLAVKAKSSSGNETVNVEEYWDDKFPLEEPESELPDWLKND